jgi:hypothetical protein
MLAGDHFDTRAVGSMGSEVGRIISAKGDLLPRRRLLRRAKTAASLPGRVVACEDRMEALENRVGQRIDEMRFELGEIRSMLAAGLEADGDATELLGQLLRASSSRLDVLEELFTPTDRGLQGTEQRD